MMFLKGFLSNRDSNMSTDFPDFSYDFRDKLDQKGPKGANIKNLNVYFFIFHLILMYFFVVTKCFSSWLNYESTRKLKRFFFFGKGSKMSPNSKISHFWKVCTNFIFHLNLMCVFFIELIVSKASTEFLYHLWFSS